MRGSRAVLRDNPVNILLVDDQPAKLLGYEVILGDLGEHLIKASSAHEALGHLLKNDIAVVLIDVQMPDLDGFELAAMIREHPRFENIALIFVSAVHISEFDRLKGYEAGAVDYVPVPVVPEVLRAKVKVFAELHRRSRELERLNAELEQRVQERTAGLEASRAELQSLNRDLETRIEQRTREREQALAQLFEAQKIDTIGQLTGGVAHDFNNLLMAVLGSLDLLQRRLKEDEQAQKLLRNAIQGAQRGAALTQRLLAFARRQELRLEAVDIAEMVAGMRDLLKRSVGPGVAIVEEIDDDLPPVLADVNQLELALMNLALNARDAMPDGGVLTISGREATKTPAAADLAPGRYVRLSVTDTGEGMNAETLARASEPFFTTKGTGKGTGLGLSMVQGLAAQSGGVMRLESRPGEGARVDVVLPTAAATDVKSPASDAPAPTAVSGESLRILLVDDDELVRVGTAAMLEDLGHSVLLACSGAEALRMLEQNEGVELMITDHAMPEMTGLELAKTVARKYAQLPIILATGYADAPSIAQDGRPIPRLQKPFLQNDLAAMITAHSRPRRRPLALAAS